MAKIKEIKISEYKITIDRIVENTKQGKFSCSLDKFFEVKIYFVYSVICFRVPIKDNYADALREAFKKMAEELGNKNGKNQIN